MCEFAPSAKSQNKSGQLGEMNGFVHAMPRGCVTYGNLTGSPTCARAVIHLRFEDGIEVFNLVWTESADGQASRQQHQLRGLLEFFHRKDRRFER